MSKRLLSGHEVEELTEEERKEAIFDSFIHGLVRFKPEGWLYPAVTSTYLDRIYNMEFRPDDIMILTFPKCGTSWMQEIIWTMLYNPKLDNPKAQDSLWLRSYDLSMDIFTDLKTMTGTLTETMEEKFREMCPGKNREEGMILHLADVQPSPRILKIHYPLSLLPKDILEKIKVVYLVRNPKDLAVSLFHFFNMTNVFQCESTMESTFKGLMNNQCLYTPYWTHVKEAWEKRHHPNLLFLFYEEMKADIMKELGKINEFLGTGLSQESLENVARHTSFSSMKSRGEPLQDKVFGKEEDNEVKFFRKGTTGDWKNHFSPEMRKEFDQWTKENLAGSDLSLSWALAE